MMERRPTGPNPGDARVYGLFDFKLNFGEKNNTPLIQPAGIAGIW